MSEREKRDGGEIYIFTSHSGLSHSENGNNLEHSEEPNRFSYKLRQQTAADEYLIRHSLTGVSFFFFLPPYLFPLPLTVTHAMKPLCVLGTLHGWVLLCCSTSGGRRTVWKILQSACKIGSKLDFEILQQFPVYKDLSCLCSDQSFLCWPCDLWPFLFPWCCRHLFTFCDSKPAYRTTLNDLSRSKPGYREAETELRCSLIQPCEWKPI